MMGCRDHRAEEHSMSLYERDHKIDELEAENERLRKLDSEAAKFVESKIVMRTHFTGEPPYVGWEGLGLAMVEKFDRDEAEIEKMRAALAYYSTYCEGWCTESNGYFEDCGGCPARKALDGGDDER